MVFGNRDDVTQKSLLEHVALTAYVAELAEWDNRAHTERIRRYASALAIGCGIDRSDAELLSLACMLHDIGKSTLPAAILQKTARLKPDEYKVAERHAEEGARMLEGSGSPILQAAEIIALTHHERWDGSGYPRGRKGEEIPLSGRIMALADVFDALTTKRSYKAVVEPEAALDLIQGWSQELFDPNLVAVFTEHFREFNAILRHGKEGALSLP